MVEMTASTKLQVSLNSNRGNDWRLRVLVIGENLGVRFI